MSSAAESATGDTGDGGIAASIAGAIETSLEAAGLSLPLCHACALSADEARDPNAIASLASGEPVIAVSLLREANGPAYDALEPADSVEQAIARIGAESAARLIAELNADHGRDDLDPVLERALRKSRTRALVVSRIGARIAATTGHPELVAKIALLGLLCDVGIPFLVRALGPRARASGDAPELNEFATREILAELAERCGQRLLVRWNLAPHSLAVLQDRAVEAEERQLATLLGMARTIVSSIGRARAGREDASELSRNLWDFAEPLGLSDVALAALQVWAVDEVKAVEREAAADA